MISKETEYRKVQDTDADFELWKLFNASREILHDIREEELNQYGITIRQAGILYAIFHDLDDYAIPADIARVTNREPNSISTIVDRMERKGLIKKSKDAHKKNVLRVSLTEKGKGAHLMATNRRSIHRIFACLSKEEIELVQSCLTKLQAKALEEQTQNEAGRKAGRDLDE
jgi:DNA-binding MarR family transcriptional regulator